MLATLLRGVSTMLPSPVVPVVSVVEVGVEVVGRPVSVNVTGVFTPLPGVVPVEVVGTVESCAKAEAAAINTVATPHRMA
jgi:hypothetical protein